jgi:hypothetical protein
VATKQILQPGAFTEQDREKVRRSVIIRQILEADKRILKLDHGMRKLIRTIEAKEKDKDSKDHKEKDKDNKENQHMHSSAPAQMRDPPPPTRARARKLIAKVSIEDHQEK